MQHNVLWLTASILLALSASDIFANVLTTSEDGNYSTDIAKEPDDRLLLFSTLDGTLAAFNQHSGILQWKVKDKPTVTVPLDTTDAIIPLFLPDPRDGSLYLLGNSREPLKKLPFTIPQLVASSPCRSSDGILYTGKKKDIWFSLDPKTGNKQQFLGWDMKSPTCPIESVDRIYVGRTEYSIMMADSRNTNRKWNVTFYDYSAHPLNKDMLQRYDFVHFSSTSTGRVITMDRRRGSLLWDVDLGSPVVAIYILDSEGLLNVPFTCMANHTISHLANHLSVHQQPFHYQPDQMKLYPTLYIGEHMYGLYAIPSLVDQNMVTITSSESGPLLLEGPDMPKCPQPYPRYPIPGKNYHIPLGVDKSEPVTFQSILDNTSRIYIGHYNVPQFTDGQLMIAGENMFHLKLLTDASDQKKVNIVKIVEPHSKEQVVETSSKDFVQNEKFTVGVQTDKIEEDKLDPVLLMGQDSYSYKVIDLMPQQGFKRVKGWINQQENKGLKLTLIILIGCIIAMFWYLQMQVREFQQLSQNGSRSSQNSSVGRYGAITSLAEELMDGTVRIGKITFHPDKLLGKGCEGTFVYSGEFDKRPVAVKRLLPECFTFADREVALLRESDAHPNVIRYFCTEQDRMFRYIALELCQATLHDYVQGKCDTTIISSLEILRQATSGLAHLHSLDIVHRDIKPHNVLLSTPNLKGEVRAMISDFGLCKKLQVGRVSFSRRSGITGTDGWIAPEMLNGNERTTCAVDMFSLGCLIYYVLSKGCHPFGDTLRRQANILGNVFELNELKGAPWQVALAKPMLAALISHRQHVRPSCNAVLAHPVFWSRTKILAFFQDVSDRIEKIESDDAVLKSLERNAEFVVRGDWRLHIDEEVVKDLRKYRSYCGDSVRDLLRALRNKKHHYRELTTEARDLLGDIPDGFVTYWTSRFPLLLVHTWLSMQIVGNEPAFANYYHQFHRYALSNYKDTDDILHSICSADIKEYNLGKPASITYNLDEKYSTAKYTIPKKILKATTTEQNTRKFRPAYPRIYVPPFDGATSTAADANHNFTHIINTLGLARNVGLYRNASKKPGDNKINVSIEEEPKQDVMDKLNLSPPKNKKPIDRITNVWLQESNNNAQYLFRDKISPPVNDQVKETTASQDSNEDTPPPDDFVVQRRKNKKLTKKHEEPLKWSLDPYK